MPAATACARTRSSVLSARRRFWCGWMPYHLRNQAFGFQNKCDGNWKASGPEGDSQQASRAVESAQCLAAG